MLIDHLRGSSRLRAGEERLRYSTITRAELFAGPAHQLDAVRALLAAMGEIPLDAAIAELGGGIRRATGVALPDALIAATALLGDRALLTRKARDFARVEGLLVRSPVD